MSQLAKAAPELQGFTHISTAYVNCTQKAGAHVEEQMYPLGFMDGLPLHHQQIAEDMTVLSPQQAEKQASLTLCNTHLNECQNSDNRQAPVYVVA